MHQPDGNSEIPMSPRTPPNPEQIKSIVVRLTNWVGDSVMNTPFLTEARALFPNAKITALGRKHVADLLLHHPAVDSVYVIDDKSKNGKSEVVSYLKEMKPDLGFALPNSLGSAYMLWRGGVKHRVGYNRDARRIFLTIPVALRPRDLAVHEVRYYLRLLSPWGVSTTNPPPISLNVLENEKDSMKHWLLQRGWQEDQPIIGVNPAAFFGTAKRWFPERYAEAAEALAAKLDALVVVTGLPTERDWAQRVVSHGGSRFYNAAGEMKLRELMAFLTFCRLYLTNDSGAMHLAAALNTPLVAVFGSTDWVTTAPTNANSIIVREQTACAPCLLRDCPIDHRCMTAVTVKRVVESAGKLLGCT